MMATEQHDAPVFDPDDDARYERDDDRVDELITSTHQTIGRMLALFGELSRHVDALEAEIKPRARGSK